MGAQMILCDGFEVVPPPPEINDLILFGSDQSGGGGSNCGESTVTTEEDGTVFSGDSSPGWREAKLFSFYFVKQHAYDDPDIKSKINQADSEIYHCNKRRIDVSNAQKSQRAEIASLYAQIESLVAKSQRCELVLEEKKRELDSLQEGLRCSQLCLSNEELDHLIYTAHYVMEHGSIGLEEEEGWLLEETLAQREASIHSLKVMAMEMNEVKKEIEAITWNIQQLSDKMRQAQDKIMVLDAEMAYILELRDKSYEKIKMLRIQRDQGNAEFYQSIAVMRKVKELAALGNVRDLELYSSSEGDRFMTRWNIDKAYRDDYVKRISPSLCERQLSQDGRNRDPEGEAQATEERLVKSKKESMAAVHKEDSSSNSSQDGDVITDKHKKEARKKVIEFNRSSAEESDVIDLEYPVYENPKKEEVDEETLKERKREEQLEKARSAMERKRKVQERAAAKAAIRAQKEAEKKLKECEKKAKKKKTALNSSPLHRSQEAVNEREKVSTLAAVSGKEKQRSMFRKQKSFRYKHRGRGTEALPKAILNRRKAHRYWVWGLSSAALALLLFLVFLLLR